MKDWIKNRIRGGSHIFLWMRRVFRARVSDPVWHLLQTGVSPRDIARAAALGSMIGIFPLLGTTTVLCTLLALSLRLNLVAVQAFNWLVAGLQLILILPFIRLGAGLFGVTPPTLMPADIEILFQQGLGVALRVMGLSLLHAVAAWALLAPLGFYGVYRIVYFTLKQPAIIETNCSKF